MAYHRACRSGWRSEGFSPQAHSCRSRSRERPVGSVPVKRLEFRDLARRQAAAATVTGAAADHAMGPRCDRFDGARHAVILMQARCCDRCRGRTQGQTAGEDVTQQEARRAGRERGRAAASYGLLAADGYVQQHRMRWGQSAQRDEAGELRQPVWHRPGELVARQRPAVARRVLSLSLTALRLASWTPPR